MYPNVKTMNNNQRKIILSPNIKQFLADEVKSILIGLLTGLGCGYDHEGIKLICLCVFVVTICYLLVRLGYYKTVVWEITPTQIKSIHGLLSRKTNYIELYRVIDYAESQSFVQQIVGLMDVYISSGDHTDPYLRIFGIPNSMDIINEIKPLVKQTRKENHIYEIANR